MSKMSAKEFREAFDKGLIQHGKKGLTTKGASKKWKEHLKERGDISEKVLNIVSNERSDDCGVIVPNDIKGSLYVLNVNPMGKPRMTRADSWKKRPTVVKYWGLKDEITLQANKIGLSGLPSYIKSLTFYIEMPKSWSKKKKQEMSGKPHQQKPDIDNCMKSVFDILCSDDSHVYKVDNLAKYWSDKGRIEIII